MTGETNLDLLLRGLSAREVPGEYVFATVPSDTDTSAIPARMIFQEAEGTTLILLRQEAEKLGIAFEFPCKMITLEIHSSLEAVGFLARITAALAAKGMGVNPVSGFFHDHLFVPVDRVDDALAVLAELAKST
jgi:hypothetical protein